MPAIQKGDQVKLERQEVLLACDLAHDVQENWGWQDSRMKADKSTNGFHDKIEGFAAELSLARLLGVFPDLTVRKRQGGHDFKLPDSRTVEVRATKAPAPVAHLTIRPGKDLDSPPDFFMLFCGQVPYFQFMGYVPSGKVKEWIENGELPLTDPGNRNAPCYRLHHSMLESGPFRVGSY